MPNFIYVRAKPLPPALSGSVEARSHTPLSPCCSITVRTGPGSRRAQVNTHTLLVSPPHVVGFANGIAQSIVSLARFIGPILGGTVRRMFYRRQFDRELILLIRRSFGL